MGNVTHPKSQLKDKNNTVVATARNTAGSKGLQDLKAQDKDGRLLLVDLDLSKPDSISAAARKTSELLPNGLDNLVSNAGVSYSAQKSFEELYVVDRQELRHSLIGVIGISTSLLPS